jgi:predicted anti-sigma-YlaC factor YlaD
MSNHVTEWLNAYLDGELKGYRLQHVEEHLAACEVCQAEFDSLQSLSGLLQEIPAPEFPSPERFAILVNLLLPQKRTSSPGSQLFEIGWWMIPVGLLAVWVFISTAAFLGGAVSAANIFGVLDNTTASFISTPADNAKVTSTLGQFGVLQGNSLQWAEVTENYTRNAWPKIVLQVSVALLYLTWIVVWWTRRTRQMNGPLLED